MSKQQKCRAQMHDGKVCGRPAQQNHATGEVACICHNSNSNKNRTEFQAELNNIFEDPNTQYYDLTGFKFPKDDWGIPKKIDKPIYFKEARFLGITDISHTTFEETASFINCVFDDAVSFSTGTVFCKRTSFTSTSFKKEANFAGCTFTANAPSDFTLAEFRGNADFLGTAFKAAAAFSGARFLSSAYFRKSSFDAKVSFAGFELSGYANIPYTRFCEQADFIDAKLTNASFFKTVFDDLTLFVNTEFRGSTDFGFSQFQSPERVYFENNDLSQVRWMGCDISKVSFRNVSWYRSPHHWLHSRRYMVADEVGLVERAKNKVRISINEFESVAETYRQLQQNYGESYRYPEAGDFYVGEQEMELQIRKRTNLILAVASWLYKRCSNYGENIVLPVMIACVIGLIFTSYLLLSGFCIDSARCDESEIGYVNYDFDPVSLSSLTREQFWANCLEALNVNLDIVLLRSGSADRHLHSATQKMVMKAESLFIASLLTLFILALRRKFKRKSF